MQNAEYHQVLDHFKGRHTVKPTLTVIDGARESLERAALQAIFEAPENTAALLQRLVRPANATLRMVPEPSSDDLTADVTMGCTHKSS